MTNTNELDELLLRIRILESRMRSNDMDAESFYLQLDEVRKQFEALIAQREAAAYERGRIAEAKTCEKARRHDTKRAIQAFGERLIKKYGDNTFEVPTGAYELNGETTKVKAVPVAAIQEELK